MKVASLTVLNLLLALLLIAVLSIVATRPTDTVIIRQDFEQMPMKEGIVKTPKLMGV